MTIVSDKQPQDAIFRHVIPAGEPYLFEVKKGQTLRLLDLEGNQAVDTLFYNADKPARTLRCTAHAAPPE
ncbi:urea carboxylase-associated protein 1 [Leclercia adecarboxylata]|uniref:Urea carboxylase-associated protein 1 n=1 Tax=Leclercia adecarboxylata TaxID=83655 RepID=A0A4U9HYI1_9ENTR|nr:urea carboxylase-associated protein 1 [Leclercia adecarboxylata]